MKRHEGTEARRHEVVTKATRDQVRTTHPHSLPPCLVPTSCLRAYVPSCLRAFFFPSPSVPNFQTNPPTVPIPPSFTCLRTPAHHLAQFLQNEPTELGVLGILAVRLPAPSRKLQNEATGHPVAPAQTCQNLPKPATRAPACCEPIERWQNNPTAILHPRLSAYRLPPTASSDPPRSRSTAQSPNTHTPAGCTARPATPP